MANLLIVDDCLDILNSYRIALEDAEIEWNILTAENEDEAEKILEEIPIDIVISDLVMLTEQSGMEVLRLARKKDPLIMVILVTAYDKKLDRYNAFELGAFDCIAKSTPGVETIDEIIVKGKTAIQFRELALNEIENQKKLTIMRKYFDPNVLKMIEKKPDLLDMDSRTLTTFFCDIRGFSKLCEILKEHPTLISNFLREYFEGSSRIIFSHGGVLDKFIGDAVMALFGTFNDDDEVSIKKDAIAAVKCAVEINIYFNQLMTKWIEKWELYTPHTIDIGLGCGLHTGDVLVGNAGTDIRDQFTALGPHVNFAQRLESEAEKGQILVSATTKGRINSEFVVTKIGSINNIKNIPGTYDMFEIEYL